MEIATNASLAQLVAAFGCYIPKGIPSPKGPRFESERERLY